MLLLCLELVQIDPLLQQLYNCGNYSSHHVYMLLIILLIFSQDECFNKSVHEIVSVARQAHCKAVDIGSWWVSAS